MPPRRRITSVIDQQHRLRELGRIRFGERKPTDAKRPGKPIQFARVSSTDKDVVEQIAKAYGGTPQPWQREEKAAPEWDVLTEGPLAIACLPGIVPYTAAYEQWAGGFLTVRCDGEACQVREKGRWVERPCFCEADGLDFKERPCKRTTRITVAILGIEKLGVFRVDTKSFNAAEEVPSTLAFLQASGRAAWMQMRRRSDKVMVWDEKKGEDVPTTRHYPVIVIEAPFMVDEVMHLERAPDMAALPAPRPRTERPQIGPGIVEPRGPQVGDREPPPREPAPVELPPPAPPAEAAQNGSSGSGDDPPAEPAKPPQPLITGGQATKLRTLRGERGVPVTQLEEILQDLTGQTTIEGIPKRLYASVTEAVKNARVPAAAPAPAGEAQQTLEGAGVAPTSPDPPDAR